MAYYGHYNEQVQRKVVECNTILGLTIPIIIFAVTFFYQYTLSGVLTPYMQVDPVTVSIFLGAFLSLSKPIGGASIWGRLLEYIKICEI